LKLSNQLSFIKREPLIEEIRLLRLALKFEGGEAPVVETKGLSLERLEQLTRSLHSHLDRLRDERSSPALSLT
jgi:hypothetical protein